MVRINQIIKCLACVGVITAVVACGAQRKGASSQDVFVGLYNCGWRVCELGVSCLQSNPFRPEPVFQGCRRQEPRFRECRSLPI